MCKIIKTFKKRIQNPKETKPSKHNKRLKIQIKYQSKQQ